MARTEVRNELVDFVVLKVDTNRYSSAAKYFEVRALLTQIVLDTRSQERLKHVGAVNIEGLQKKLHALK